MGGAAMGPGPDMLAAGLVPRHEHIPAAPVVQVRAAIVGAAGVESSGLPQNLWAVLAPAPALALALSFALLSLSLCFLQLE